MPRPATQKPASILEEQIVVSTPRLRLALQSVYEAGRRSAGQRSFSIAQVFTGAFVTELISAVYSLFSNGSFELVKSGVIPTSLYVHAIVAVSLCLIAIAAYAHSVVNRDLTPSETEKRDIVISDEIDDLFRRSSSGQSSEESIG